jgi:stearoyl-CoA desaturase (delta-9 desaturase)
MNTYIYGLINLDFWHYVLLSFVLVMISMMAITLYLHRDQAHRAIDLHPFLRHFFRFWLWINTGMQTDQWVAVHRKHHALCEREGDPHSPQVFGLTKVLLEGAELYKAEARRPDVVEKYSRGTPRDWMQRNVYWRWPNGGIVLLVLACLLLFGVPGIIILGVQLLATPVLAAGVINGLAHDKGYRNFETDDASTNLTPFAILIGGEELHNNHHAFPTSAKFSVRWWEFDIGWMYICIFRFFGLCSVRRVAPRPQLADTRPVDMNMLQAILVNRMHVLRDYTQRVTLPVLKREKLAAKRNALLVKARRLFIVRPQNLDSAGRDRLQALLDGNQTLRKVHDLREQLVQIWQEANVSNERLVKELHDWCVAAESSGIQALEEFSARLRGYRLEAA